MLKALEVLSQKNEAISLKNLFNGEVVLFAAIAVQNAMHPKNANRVEAIKGGLYRELRSLDDANSFFSDLLTTNLKNEVMAIESEIIKE